MNRVMKLHQGFIIINGLCKHSRKDEDKVTFLYIAGSLYIENDQAFWNKQRDILQFKGCGLALVTNIYIP